MYAETLATMGLVSATRKCWSNANVGRIRSKLLAEEQSYALRNARRCCHVVIFAEFNAIKANVLLMGMPTDVRKSVTKRGLFASICALRNVIPKSPVTLFLAKHKSQSNVSVETEFRWPSVAALTLNWRSISSAIKPARI